MSTIRLDELDQTIQSPLSIVVNDVLLSQLVPGGDQLLAVSTPGGIELNQDILLGVHGNLFEVLPNQNLDRFLVPVLRHLLTHQMWLQSSIQILLHEHSDVLLAQLSGLGLELGHVLFQLDYSHGWELRLVKTKELHDPLVVFFISVDSDKEHLTLVVLGNSLGNVDLSREVLSSSGEEEQQVGLDFSGEYFLSCFLVELNHEGEGIARHEHHDGFLRHFSLKIITSFIKVLEQYYSR